MTALNDVTWKEVNDHVSESGSLSQDISSDVEIVNGDKVASLYLTTGSSNVTVTLTSDDDNRTLTIKKVDNGNGSILFVGNIDGDTDKKIGSQNTSITIKYDNNDSVWRII